MRRSCPAAGSQRRIRFSIRTLLILIAFAAVLAFFLSRQVHRAGDQRRVVTRLLNLGGTVRYDYENTGDRPNEFDSKAHPPGPAWFHDLIGDEHFQDVVLVNLRDKPITDDQLVELTRLPKLENLNLTNTKITGAGLVHIGRLSNLQYLSLGNTQVDDDGLRHIANSERLWALILDGTNVTDEGLKHLKGLTNLEEWLGLVGTNVTDAGLVHLQRLTKLRSLNLRKTKVTADGVRELQRALPNAHNSYGP